MRKIENTYLAEYRDELFQCGIRLATAVGACAGKPASSAESKDGCSIIPASWDKTWEAWDRIFFWGEFTADDVLMVAADCFVLASDCEMLARDGNWPHELSESRLTGAARLRKEVAQMIIITFNWRRGNARCRN